MIRSKNVSSLLAKTIFLLVVTTSNVATLFAKKTTNDAPWHLPFNKNPYRRRPFFHLPFCPEKRHHRRAPRRWQRVTSHGSSGRRQLTTISSILCIDPGGATNFFSTDGGERTSMMPEETNAATVTDAITENDQSPNRKSDV